MLRSICLLTVCLLGIFAKQGQAQPARNLFRATVLMENLTNPTQMAFLPDGRIYVLNKSGTIKLFDPQTKASNVLILGMTKVIRRPLF